MMEITHSKFTDDFELPHASGLIEQCYQAEIQKIIQEWKEDRALQRAAATERDDYYTLWTHQIKTPLYSMDKYNRPDELVRSMSCAFASWDAAQ